MVDSQSVRVNSDNATPFTGITPNDYDKVVRSITTPKDLISARPRIFDLAEWDGDLSSRRFDVKSRGLTIECFGTPAHKKSLYIFLSAAGRTSTKTIFHRVSWHPWFNGACLNIEDPTYKKLSGKVTTGWFFGSEETHGLAVVADLVRKVQENYKIPSEEIYFIGSSSGGFAAIWLANEILGSLAIAGNPQFYAKRWPSAFRFADAGIDLNADHLVDRTNLDHINLHGSSRYLVITNAKSKIDFKGQIPFFVKAKKLPRIHYGLNKFGNFFLYCKSMNSEGSISNHHSMEDAREMRALIDLFQSGLSQKVMAPIMDMMHEVQYSRLAIADRLFFINQWTAFFRDCDLPIILPNEPIGSNTARAQFRGYGDRLTVEVKLTPKAKFTRFQLTAKTSDEGTCRRIEAMAKARVGVIKIDGEYTLLKFGKFHKKTARKLFFRKIRAAANYLYDDSIKSWLLISLSISLRNVLNTLHRKIIYFSNKLR